MKNRFYGKYYKFVNNNGFSFAFIVSHSNEGDMLQIVTKESAYYFNDNKMIIIDDSIITFNVVSDTLTIKGQLTLGDLHPLKHLVMGPFTYLPMECSHQIYSMYHTVNGEININNKVMTFNNALGYIEGDKGVNFPKKYIWYNSITKDATITFAIASIPLFKVINFTGLLCFIKTKDKEYRFCTYNNGKVIKNSEEEIIIRKGKYTLTLTISTLSGHNLKAPVKGDMVRFIKENLCIPTRYILRYKDDIVLENDDELSSLEYMW